VPPFWLTYRHRGGSFASALVIESNALINARTAIAGADKGVTFVSGDMLDDEGASCPLSCSTAWSIRLPPVRTHDLQNKLPTRSARRTKRAFCARRQSMISDA
jgi:hypothetical protein